MNKHDNFPQNRNVDWFFYADNGREFVQWFKEFVIHSEKQWQDNKRQCWATHRLLSYLLKEIRDLKKK